MVARLGFATQLTSVYSHVVEPPRGSILQRFGETLRREVIVS